MSWKTWSGKLIDPFDLHAEDICIDDIAVSLSHINRYNGHTNAPFSVAQHSVLLAHFVPKIYEFTGQAAVDVAGAALLHDAPETYLQDIISSEKDKLYFKLRGEFIPYKLIERKAQEVVFDRFNVPIEYLAYVEPWDKAICANEKLALQPAADLLPISLYMTPIVPWTPEYARKQFLQMFYALNLDPYERKH